MMDTDDYTNDDVESSGDEVDFAMQMDNNREWQVDNDYYPYEVLSTDDIVKHMVHTIRDVNVVVEIPATTTRILLNHFKWDKEKLMDGYYSGDSAKLFADAKVVNPFKNSISQNPRHPIPTAHTEECGMCMMLTPNSMMTGLKCGHRYCTDCWAEYLRTKIMEDGVGQTIACAAHACDILVDDDSVMRLVRDTHVKQKYQILITNSFVECNRLIRWCPTPGCSHAIKVQYVEPQPVSCRCGHSFCFSCGETWHDPVRCSLLKKWIKSMQTSEDDSKSEDWISTNTKGCPKCHANIEKNGGCNHMTCTNASCKTEFCWVCLQLWRSHNNCNSFVQDQAKEQSRIARERYVFYCRRYMNHMQSLRFEYKLYATIRNMMADMQKHDMYSWLEVQFLKKAVDTLCQCRQTLMHTYVFAYTLRPNNHLDIFEENQRDLEAATEILSEYLERDISSDNLCDIKQKVQDRYKYCESRRKVLLEHVREGRENNCWIYAEST